MTLTTVGIDPGTTMSAYTIFESNGKEHCLVDKGKVPNGDLLKMLRSGCFNMKKHPVFIEGMRSQGMAVGQTTFDTCYLIGRIMELLEQSGTYVTMIYRGDVKMHHCASMRAKDGNIRQALIDRFGPVGTKREQGVLYGVSADVWSSTAIAVLGWDRLRNG